MYYVTFLKPQNEKLTSLKDKFFEEKRGIKSKEVMAFVISHNLSTEEELAEENEKWWIQTLGTETVVVDKLPEFLVKAVNLPLITEKLKEFNSEFSDAVEDESKRKLYKEVIYYEENRTQSKHIPKRRWICALEGLIKVIKSDICTGNIKLFHNSVKISDVIRYEPLNYFNRHRCVYPIKDFEIYLRSKFIFESLEKVYPFCVIMENEAAKNELCKALGSAFVYGKLYKDTPIFKLIMNAAMIPIDYALASSIECYDGQSLTYIREGKNIEIASRDPFTAFEMRFFIDNILEESNTPFRIDAMKMTLFDNGRRNTIESVVGKTSVSPFSENEIKHFHDMLKKYVVDKKSGSSWSKEEIVNLEALRNYYGSKELGSVDRIIKSLNEEFDFNIVKNIIQDLRS